MSHYRRVVSNAPMSSETYRSYQVRKGKERAQRGFVSYSRPEMRESVFGRTPGESSLARGARTMQTDQSKKSRRR